MYIYIFILQYTYLYVNLNIYSHSHKHKSMYTHPYICMHTIVDSWAYLNQLGLPSIKIIHIYIHVNIYINK